MTCCASIGRKPDFNLQPIGQNWRPSLAPFQIFQKRHKSLEEKILKDAPKSGAPTDSRAKIWFSCRRRSQLSNAFITCKGGDEWINADWHPRSLATKRLKGINKYKQYINPCFLLEHALRSFSFSHGPASHVITCFKDLQIYGIECAYPKQDRCSPKKNLSDQFFHFIPKKIRGGIKLLQKRPCRHGSLKLSRLHPMAIPCRPWHPMAMAPGGSLRPPLHSGTTRAPSPVTPVTLLRKAAAPSLQGLTWKCWDPVDIWVDIWVDTSWSFFFSLLSLFRSKNLTGLKLNLSVFIGSFLRERYNMSEKTHNINMTNMLTRATARECLFGTLFCWTQLPWDVTGSTM